MAEATYDLRLDVDVGGGWVVDVLCIQAPTVLAGLEATRGQWSGYLLRVLDAPKGGGKTYALARLAGERAVCVSDRKALAAQIAAGFGGEFRRDPGSSRQVIKGQTELAARFSCTLHTTPRLAHRNMQADTLVVDEAIHVLGTLATGTELRGRRRGTVFDAFLSAIHRCHDAWFAQANWSMADVNTLVQTINKAGRTERVLMVVVQTPERRGLALEVPNVEALRDAALGTVEPWVYCSTSRKSCEQLQQEAIRLGLDPLVVSARTVHSLRAQRWLGSPQPEVEPCVILSPTVVSGLSIHARPDGSPAYPQVFMEFCTWPGGLSLDDGLQMVARVRGTPTLHWWASSSPWEVRSAEVHYAEEEDAAAASAKILKMAVVPGTGLDDLAASRVAANELSLGPSPCAAFGTGLARDGWSVMRCEPVPALAADRARWALAKERARAAYVRELVSAERGPVDQQTVAERLAELGLPPTTDALSGPALEGIEWLERGHSNHTPLDLLVALLAPDEARATDAMAMAAFACRRDLPYCMLRAELVLVLFLAANIDLPRLVRGGVVEVRNTDLRSFTAVAWRHAAEMGRLLGIQAPKGPGGSIRAIGTLMGRLGAGKVGSRRPSASGRVRAYTFKLSPIALEAMTRRLGDFPDPVMPDGKVFARTETDVLRSMVPMRLSPDVRDSLPALKDRFAHAVDPSEKTRLEGIIRVVEKTIAAISPGSVGPMDWLLFAKRYRRGDAGRIQLLDAPLQSIPKTLRSVITPELSSDVFVSGDFRSCHIAIAAARTGDAGLQKLLTAEDAYADLAVRFLSGSEERGKMKQVVLAMLNGAGPGEIGRITGSPKGREIHATLMAEFPGLAEYFLLARKLQEAPGSTVEIPTLTGASRTITKRVGGWKRLLSAFWMGPESEALGYVLAHLPVGARLAAPMHDGLLVCCVREDAERVAAELRKVMIAGAQAAGFEAGVKVGVGETWAEAEGSAV